MKIAAERTTEMDAKIVKKYGHQTRGCVGKKMLNSPMKGKTRAENAEGN
jgi:hypothetical protein